MMDRLHKILMYATVLLVTLVRNLSVMSVTLHSCYSFAFNIQVASDMPEMVDFSLLIVNSLLKSSLSFVMHIDALESQIKSKVSSALLYCLEKVSSSPYVL